MTNGTGANQATSFATDTRTLAATASETLDFNGGLVDSFGNVLTFTRLIFFMVKAHPSNIADLRISIPGVAPIASLTFTAAGTHIGVPAGGCVVWASRTAAAYAVVAGAEDQLTFTNMSSFNSATYDIVVIGS